MRKIKHALKIALVNIAILAALIEVASIATYFFQTGSFFYRNSGNRKLAGLAIPPSDQASKNEATQQQLHPYFGFVDRVGLSHRFLDSQIDHVSNNFGFASEHPYPFKRQHPNQFLVGVFGGSVAANYSFFELEKNILAAQLKKLPGLANKEVIVLPFAMGAFKQPQQLIVLSYFLSLGQDFDLVINIDGFNDVALSYINYKDGLDPSMPCGYIFMPLVALATGSNSEAELQLTLQVIKDRRSLEDSIKSVETSRFASGYMLAWLRAKFSQRRYREDVVKLDQLRTSTKRLGQSLFQIPVQAKPTEDQAFEEAVASWAGSSLMMKQILDQRNIPYFQFLQPNQYQPTGRAFGKDEASIAIDGASPFRSPVLKGYPMLLAEVGRLQHKGVHVQSAINVFDSVKEAVYGDNCCHYNQLGNRIFGEYVAGTIQRALSKDNQYALPGSQGQ